MIKSLEYLKEPEKHLDEVWVHYLFNTKEKNFNVNNVDKLTQITNHSVMNYVIKTLDVLDEVNNNENLDSDVLYYVEETLKWSEVAKTGDKETIKNWKQKHYDLFCHNIGSYEIYKETNNDEIVATLIKTHGLVGQYIKGEINLDKNKELYELVLNNKIDKDKLRQILLVLNRCIIEGVSKKLYENIKDKMHNVIENILDGKFNEQFSLVERLTILNKHLNDEEINYLNNLDEDVERCVTKVFEKLEIWYFESACSEFTIEEQIKIFLLVYKKLSGKVAHLSFEKLMRGLYLDYKNKKEINLYKKRIIEAYLKEITLENILEDNISPNPHISYSIRRVNRTLIFNFRFSKQARKLIEFCEAANTSNSLYQKATYMLYDLLGFRRDAYDRFYNEIDYLNTMNASLNEKAVILKYMVGQKILDVGPGGGALLDLIEKSRPELDVYGIDLSQNVIDKLQAKKIKENHAWNIVKGDALNLSKYFKDVDTIIYSSIIHELYSYIEFNGKKFNKDTIKCALKEAYNALAPKGRIIIRDGIMTSPKEQYRLIEFKDEQDIEILKRYCNDFEGRKVSFEKINQNTVKMLVNDAMEFLYTYTWGEQSYPLEIKEQFGYFTPEEYVECIKSTLPGAKIVECKSFLQNGYEENLLPKISIYDENKKTVKLPNSTCIIVIEKGNI